MATIGVPIVGRRRDGAASIRTDPARVTAGDPVDLTIRIENTGTADAESVRQPSTVCHSGEQGGLSWDNRAGNDGPADSPQADQEGESIPIPSPFSIPDDYGVHTTGRT